MCTKVENVATMCWILFGTLDNNLVQPFSINYEDDDKIMMMIQHDENSINYEQHNAQTFIINSIMSITFISKDKNVNT